VRSGTFSPGRDQWPEILRRKRVRGWIYPGPAIGRGPSANRNAVGGVERGGVEVVHLTCLWPPSRGTVLWIGIYVQIEEATCSLRRS
jgi:hypothetical protein